VAVVHIVRRYGLVGGMEGYVWELTHALVAIGVEVDVICEQLFGNPSADIRVHTVTPDKSPSRWKAMLGFRARVNSLITKQFADRKMIIHSHERTLNHHITTFHGPPMQAKTHWWRFSWLSPRIKAWTLMEKDELLGPQVKFILPVSNRIKEQLVSLHPDIKNKSVVVAYPGIHEVSEKQTTAIRNTKKDARFIFIGKEWKRKGLKFAVELIDGYASRFGPCTMDIYGPAPSDLPRFIRQHTNLTIKGWSKEISWSEYDALIHPATNEPFGMVVPEARGHAVPVLTTNVVGSTELNYRGVIALKPTEDIETWVSNLAHLIKDDRNRITEIKWTWRQLALKHLHEIYPLTAQSLNW
jgi:hypothetical protein